MRGALRDPYQGPFYPYQGPSNARKLLIYKAF